ncbi:hypothetical protein BE17_29325 [Sorangium cellulosum]|uniref:Uncharacterized protein n=1 Tax=Sorangium cellulosum TaxID=56 RepID=A0A150RE58_SORCE|nr:hypothetical protein BE17_29325 [Sorangium cellulosum]
MVRPRAFRSSTTPQISRRDAGSRPVLGSSRKSTSGSPASAQASDSRCFCPPESPRTNAPAFSCKDTRRSASAGSSPRG